MYMYIIGSDFGAVFFRCISSILLSFQCGNHFLAAYFYFFVIKHSPKSLCFLNPRGSLLEVAPSPCATAGMDGAAPVTR